MAQSVEYLRDSNRITAKATRLTAEEVKGLASRGRGSLARIPGHRSRARLLARNAPSVSSTDFRAGLASLDAGPRGLSFNPLGAELVTTNCRL